MRMFKSNCFYGVIIFHMLSATLINAQNLVPNPGFENLSSPLTGEGQLQLAYPWTTPGAGTPDVFNTSFSGGVTPCDAVGIPSNFGGQAPAISGNGYAGFSVDYANGAYEYLQVPLAIPLQSGDYYSLDMDILLADSSAYCSNRIGAVLSTSAWAQTGTSLIGITPTFENYQNAIVSDTLNWAHLTFSPGVFQATGGEGYLTIGIFRATSDPNLQINTLPNLSPQCSSVNGKAYYYIDNVVLKPINELVTITTGDTVVCPNETTVLTANANVPFYWSDQFNPNDTLSTNFNYNATPPNVTTTYYLHGQNKTDSVTIYVVNPPSFDLGPDTTFCEGDTVTLNAYAPDAILYTWSTGDSTATTLATDTGVYWVIVDNLGCGVFDSIHFHTLLPNPPVDIGTDSTYCFFDNDTLFLNAGDDGIAYSWYPFGDTTAVIKVLQPAYYRVTVTRANGCKRRAGFEVIEVCEPKIFIPEAFTPDGDGLNDFFRPLVNNVTQYSLQVYARTGKLLFSSGDPSSGWDGKYNGREMPADVYTYRLFYSGFNADGEKKKGRKLGTITLIR